MRLADNARLARALPQLNQRTMGKPARKNKTAG
jgi:hypothetical protein